MPYLIIRTRVDLNQKLRANKNKPRFLHQNILNTYLKLKSLLKTKFKFKTYQRPVKSQILHLSPKTMRYSARNRKMYKPQAHRPPKTKIFFKPVNFFGGKKLKNKTFNTNYKVYLNFVLKV